MVTYEVVLSPAHDEFANYGFWYKHLTSRITSFKIGVFVFLQFPKGQYFVKDAVVASEIKKTIFLPGKWKAAFQCTNKDDVLVFSGEFYFTIDEKLVN